MDCEIIIKIRDEAIRKELRSTKPVNIVRRAERARAQATRTLSNVALAGNGFVTARQLPSEDISLQALTAAVTKVLRQHAEDWVQAFESSAWVRIPT